MKSFNRIRRLNGVVSDFIDENGLDNITIADVGADHGYLAELLSRNEKISKVIATDISKKCLEKTEKLVADFKLDKVETRLGDGLEPIERVDIVVVAGVGGYEIIKILNYQNITKSGEKKSRFFIFEPSKNTVELRQFLIEKNMAILRDFIIESGGRFYSIIVVDTEKENTVEKNIFNLYFGRDNDVSNPEFIGFLKFELELLDFMKNLTKEQIENDENTKNKYEIFMLANKILKERQGEWFYVCKNTRISKNWEWNY